MEAMGTISTPVKVNAETQSKRPITGTPISNLFLGSCVNVIVYVSVLWRWFFVGFFFVIKFVNFFVCFSLIYVSSTDVFHTCSQILGVRGYIWACMYQKFVFVLSAVSVLIFFLYLSHWRKCENGLSSLSRRLQDCLDMLCQERDSLRTGRYYRSLMRDC